MSVSSDEGMEKKLVGAMGFEPMTPASRTLCADQTALRPGFEVLIINAIKGSVKLNKMPLSIHLGNIF